MNDQSEKAILDAVLFDYRIVPRYLYCMYDIDEFGDDPEHNDKNFPYIGLLDFLIFDLLLLLVILANLSITTRACIAFGGLISVQIGDIRTNFMLHYIESGVPAVPFPTVTVTAYAIVIDAIIQYTNAGCEDSLK